MARSTMRRRLAGAGSMPRKTTRRCPSASASRSKAAGNPAATMAIARPIPIKPGCLWVFDPIQPGRGDRLDPLGRCIRRASLVRMT